MNYLMSVFFFLLPLQTQWILRYGMLNGQSWEYGTIGIYATDIFLAIIFALSFWGGHADARIRFRSRQCAAGMTVMIVVSALSIIAASDRSVALVHILWLIEAGIVGWLVSRSRYRSIISNSFVTGSVLQALIGLWQFFSQSTVASALMGWAAHPAWLPGTSVIEREGERWLRAYAGFAHPNVFGGWMAVAIVAAVYCILTENRPRVRVVLLCSLVFLSCGLAVSFSRSAWIAAAIGVGALSLSLRVREGCLPVGKAGRELCVVLAIIVLSVSAILVPYRSLLETRFEATARLERQSLNERAQSYHDAFALMRQHPFIGVGIGNFTSAVAALDPQRPLWSIQPVHNSVLLIIAELGVADLSLIVAAFCYYLKLRRQSKNPILYSLFSILFVLALFDHYLWSLHVGSLLVGFFIGWTLSTPQFQPRRGS